MAKTLISTSTASASTSLDITSGIDSTYPVYEFHCVNMHPATDNVNFTFQVNVASGSGFNEAVTAIAYRAYINEGDTDATFGYDTGNDQAQGTAYQQILSTGTGNDNDQSVSGVLTLYDPSSTTFVKHFLAVGNGADGGDFTVTSHHVGYINTTSAIDEISFKFSSGNIDAGVIKMFGVS
jgi:hypothetical protein